MSHSRPDQSKVLSGSSSGLISKLKSSYLIFYDRFSENPFFKPVVQTAITIPAVVFSTFPLELMGNLRRSGDMRAYRPGYVLAYMVANRWNLATSVAAAHKQCAVKNSVLSQKENVHGTLKEKSATEEDINIHGEIELPWAKRIGVTVLSTWAITCLDIGLTQYWSNIRLTSQLGIIPVLNNCYDKMTFAYKTVGARFWMSIFSIGGVIGGGLVLKPMLENEFPIPKYGYLSAVLSGVLPAMVSAPISNVWDVIRVNQMKELNPQTLQLPSIWSVVKDLYNTNGYKVFMRGVVSNIAYTATAFTAIAVVDQWVKFNLFNQKLAVPNQTIDVQLEDMPTSEVRQASNRS